MIRNLFALAAAAALLAMPIPTPASAQDYRPLPPRAGVILSSRERKVAYPVRLPDGRVAERAGSGGIPWLFGIGGVYGKASAMPLTNGATPSVLASTPSSGIVPGQEPQ